ncbi:unnamed protein product [Brachionus calyciflorus]|uniref:C2H2-type domain-containing protein n=1 Tax=Brachionus calyciflorus TaxID=104777 RepID=A0A814R259_9BILA|nr:unnamed protein product [Brachionus calyciflorus]
MCSVEDYIDFLKFYNRLHPQDPLYDNFTKNILPSCVSEYKLPNGANTNSFKCPFEACAIFFSRGHLLEAHFIDEHYDEIPIGVFGIKTVFICEMCYCKFKSFKAFKSHRKNYDICEEMQINVLLNAFNRPVYQDLYVHEFICAKCPYNVLCLEANGTIRGIDEIRKHLIPCYREFRSSKNAYKIKNKEIFIKSRVDQMLENGLLNKADPLFGFFVEYILPSLVFETCLGSGYYVCPFGLCGYVGNYDQLEFHLSNHHFDQLPLNIFGKKTEFKCEECFKLIQGFEAFKDHYDHCFYSKHYYNSYQKKLCDWMIFLFVKHKNLRKNDPKFLLFRDQVLPSIVIESRTFSGNVLRVFDCPFCKIYKDDPKSLVKHLQKRHSDKLPENVFETKSLKRKRNDI